MPSWWYGIRSKTEEEDAQKIDHIVFTDRGEIPLQTKTSLLKKEDKSIKKRTENNIPIIYVSLDESDLEIRNRAIKIIANERAKKTQKGFRGL